VAGLAATFGSGAMTNPMRDLLKAEVILITGTNTSETHPIIANYMYEAISKHGAKLIVADPRRIDMVRHATLWLQQRSGTDVAWINGLMHIIIKENLQDQAYIDERTEAFAELKSCVEKYTPEIVTSITGITEENLYSAARLYAKADPASICFTMGITQHTTGTDNVKSLANLAMLCGNVGREGGGVNPLRGQNNVQGSCDMGGLPNVFPAYQPVVSDEVRQKFAKAWEVDGLPSNIGLTVTEMFAGAETGRVKGLYIMGENPMMSDPDIHHIEHCIGELEFLVVQDLFLTETAKLADVVLPAACFAEKDGTFTNTERRVTRVRKAVEPPGEAKDDALIISEISKRMGYTMPSVAEDIMEEIRMVTPSYNGITYSRLEEGGLHWPCLNEEHPGTPILHIGQFTRGKGLFFAIDYIPPTEVIDDEYPFVLNTGRVSEHYHTGTMTRRGTGLNRLCPEALVEINPTDAEALDLSDGDFLEINSRRGSIKIKAHLTRRTNIGTVFVPFHFHEAAANILTHTYVCPVAKIPGFKVSAVKINKLVKVSEKLQDG
jgi:formate dehydrogenase alpha subunit